MARRQVSIFINGKAVENTIVSINKEMRALRAITRSSTRGSKEYNDAVREINRLNPLLARHRNNVRGLNNSWGKVTKILGKAGAVAGITFAADALVDMGKAVFSNEIKMEALQKRAQTVFGETLPEVQKNARKFAKDLGLTTREYVNQAAAIGDLLIPMGFQRTEAAAISTELLNVAGALSEFTGGQKSSKEVAESLNKALLGEREELKSLGISITEAEVSAKLAEKGLKGLTGATLQQAKAAATLELINEKSVDAQTAYAENTDTLIRRQARLQAQIGDVAGKLTTLLVPVFEKLVQGAELLANGIEYVSDAFGDFIAPAESAIDAFNDQKTAVEDLESTLPTLLDRYSDLKEQSELSKEEQEELKSVISEIANIVPTAITEFGEYGEALDISTEKAENFIEAQRLLLTQKNEEAIHKNTEALEQYQIELEKAKQLSNWKDEEGNLLQYQKTYLGFSAEIVKRSNEDVTALQNQISSLQKSIETTSTAIDILKGKNPLDTKEEDGGDVSPSNDEALQQEAKAEKLAKQRAKQAEKARAQRQKEAQRLADSVAKEEQKLNDVIAQFREARRVAELDEEDQKIAALEAKYNEQIEKAKENRAQGSEEATEQILELERQREEAVLALREEFAAAEEEKKIEAKELLAEEVATEDDAELLRLENHYLDLIALADKYGFDTTEIKRKWEDEKTKIAKKASDEQIQTKKDLADKEIEEARRVIEAEFKLKTQRVAILADIGQALAGLVDENSKAGKAIFLFNKAVAVADVIINLQKEIALAGVQARTLPPIASEAYLAASTVRANIGAGIRIGTIAATAIKGVAQKKKGRWLHARGQDDGVLYHTRYVGEQPTGMLNYNHPIMMHSAGQPVIANEAGPEYFVSNSALSDPMVFDHVQAIDNIVKHRQFKDGGFNTTTEKEAPDTATAVTDSLENSRMIEAVENNNALMQMLLTRGVMAHLPDKTIVDANDRLKSLNAASGGVLN